MNFLSLSIFLVPSVLVIHVSWAFAVPFKKVIRMKAFEICLEIIFLSYFLDLEIKHMEIQGRDWSNGTL